MSGRPKKDDSKGRRKELRIDESEYEMLEYLQEKLDITSSDVLRKGLKILYNLEKSKE